MTKAKESKLKIADKREEIENMDQDHIAELLQTVVKDVDALLAITRDNRDILDWASWFVAYAIDIIKSSGAQVPICAIMDDICEFAQIKLTPIQKMREENEARLKDVKEQPSEPVEEAKTDE